MQRYVQIHQLQMIKNTIFNILIILININVLLIVINTFSIENRNQDSGR